MPCGRSRSLDGRRPPPPPRAAPACSAETPRCHELLADSYSHPMSRARLNVKKKHCTTPRKDEKLKIVSRNIISKQLIGLKLQVEIQHETQVEAKEEKKLA